MNEIKANIGQELLNLALGKIALSGEQELNGKVNLPLLPDPEWSVAIRYSVSGISSVIETGSIRVSADVHVEGAVTAVKMSVPFSYTNRVDGTSEVNLQGPALVIGVTSLNVPVYFQLPKGLGKITLPAPVNVCRYLSEPVVVKFRLLPDSYSISLPGGQSITLALDNPSLNLLPGCIEFASGIK